MHLNSDNKLTEYLENHTEAKHDWEKYKKLKNHDPRVTRVGKFIRKYSLDELPQLINVLSGKMSLVGPRPYLAEELEGKDAFIDMIIRVKPGITGLWQISGRSELPFVERNSLDEYYIRNWSLWLDITILLKSIKVLFSRRGAY
jgi:undecaprenyl-phosphate galactose phosphotransferase